MSKKSHEGHKDNENTSHPKHDFSQTAGDIEDQLKEISINLTRYVKKNPIKTNGFSLLAGVIVEIGRASSRERV